MKKNSTKKKSGMSVEKMVSMGAGVAVLGAGAYYLLGPNAKAHQKKAKALMTKMKKGVRSEMKKAKDASVSLYKLKVSPNLQEKRLKRLPENREKSKK